MLAIRKLTKRLPDGRLLLDNVSFQVSPGEFVGILGPSGAGKTLTIRSVVGLTDTQGGAIQFTVGDGPAVDTTRLKGRALHRVRRQIGVIFQGLQLVKQLTVIENVMIGRLGSISPLRSLLYGFTDREAAAAERALERVQMADFAGRLTSSLSGGEMQRVAIARAIFQEPVLYLADEPIASLDPRNSQSIMRLLRGLAQESPVLGAFHQPEMTRRFCTRVIGLKAGRVVYDGAPDLSPRQLREIYGEELDEIQAREAAVT